MAPMKIISRQEDLVSFHADLDASKRFALDLEFIPEKTFRPVLALVQVATPSQIYIIDPLAQLSLDGLWNRMADPHFAKVLHAGREDLSIIFQLSKLMPQNIFDTQIAAGFLGLGYPTGYKKLLAEVLHTKISKSESFTDWLARPLSQLQIEYAEDDVRYLLPLADQLIKMLKEKDRLTWVMDECISIFGQETTFINKDHGFFRIKGARGLSRQKLAILEALCQLRTQEAKRNNKPLKSILSDISLLELSKKMPTDVSAFDEMRGLNLGQAKRLGREIIAAIKQTLSLPENDWPSSPSTEMVSDAEVLIGDVLYALLKVEAFSAQVAPELVATRGEAQKLVAQFQADCHADKSLPILKGWRYELIGKKLVAILTGAKVKIELELKEELPVKMSI